MLSAEHKVFDFNFYINKKSDNSTENLYNSGEILITK